MSFLNMSRGTFRVGLRESYKIDSNGDYHGKGYSTLHDDYVPKSFVLHVCKYAADLSHPHNATYALGSDPFSVMACMLERVLFTCTCDSDDWFTCTCITDVFPVYELTVANHHIEILNQKTNSQFVPKTLTYLLHPCEREHMERYLAGTDDPMYDFVHELRYGPNAMGGRERSEAKDDLLSGGAKRMRSDK